MQTISCLKASNPSKVGQLPALFSQAARDTVWTCWNGGNNTRALCDLTNETEYNANHPHHIINALPV